MTRRPIHEFRIPLPPSPARTFRMQIQADCSLALLGGFPDLGGLGGLLAVLAYLTPQQTSTLNAR